MPGKSSNPLKVFIGCPGDMAPERAALLSLRDHLDELGCPVRFLIWKNATPGAGDAQKVIFDNYPIADWDIFIGLLWTRFGVPSGIVDPLSGETLTGTESEFAGAYDAFVASGGKRPQILLYRCTRDLPIDFDIDQFTGVRKFFKQTETGALRPALTQDFKTAAELEKRVTKDLVKVAERLRNAAKKPAISEVKAARVGKKELDWAAAEESYRRHLCDAHRIVKFHTAEARAPVEVELEKVFIKLMAHARHRLTPAEEAAQQTEFQTEAYRTLRATGTMESPVIDRLTDRFLAQLLAEPTPTSLPDLLRQHYHLALAGSPGSGKSTLLQYLLLTYVSGKQKERLGRTVSRLPVLIRLRQFHRWVEQQRHEKRLDVLKPGHLAQFLAHQWREEISAPELPPGFFERLLCVETSAGQHLSHRVTAVVQRRPDTRALILFDGLDEVAVQAARREIAALVATSLGEWRWMRVILTLRPKAWESEGRAALGSRVGEARICDLDDAQIEEFVRHWYLAATLAARGDTPSARGHAESRAVDLIGAVKPERIRKLAATPLMLSILAMVHSRGVGLPQERSQLYHECIEFMLGYWDEIAGFSPDPELHEVARLERQTKRQILEPVALWMHRLGSEQIEPLHDDLVKRFAAGFTSVLNEPPDCAQRHARLFLKLIVERGGLMQESEAGQFRFVHLTFQEYLAASAIAHGEAPFAQVEPHLHDPWWREVILLAGGELSRLRYWDIKTETTKWLTGILEADTWAEKYLLRDLQLAAQSCADMSETGVDAKITADLAEQIIEVPMRAHGAEPTVDLDDFIRQLPAGPLTRAIATGLVAAIPLADEEIQLSILLDIAEFLPTSVIPPELLELFEKASHSRDGGVARQGASLCILHGPESARLAMLGTLHHQIGASLSLRDPSLTRLFDLGDAALTEAILDWHRERFSSQDSDTLESSASWLIRHGTAADRAAALAAFVARLAIKGDTSIYSEMTTLGELGSLADTPEVIASLETILADPHSQNISDTVWAWEDIVSKRTTPVQIAPLRAILNDTTSGGWKQAAAVALKHGDPKDREAIRADVKAQIDDLPPSNRLEWVDFLLVSDPETDRLALAAQVEDILAQCSGEENSANSANPWRTFQIARHLAELSWNCPRLIALIRNLAQSTRRGCEEAVEVLAELVRIRPVDASISAPTPDELAEMALNLRNNPDRSVSVMIQAIQAVSILQRNRSSTRPEDAISKAPPTRKTKTATVAKGIAREP